MITRADIENELAKYDTQIDQYEAISSLIEKDLTAGPTPVVNGPLAEYLNSERVSLKEFILAELPTYQNWIKHA